MNVFVVSAHDDPKSFLAALHNTALGALDRAGHTVVVSDLYAQGFNPVASISDFVTTSGAKRANYMFEQQRTVNTGSGFSADITAEMDKLKDADLVIFHVPLWWGSVPAIMKGWFDRVLAMGFAWDADNKYDKGLLRGKKVLVTVTAGDPESYYTTEGVHRASVQQHLYGLLHNTLAFCGFDVLKPMVISNVTAGSNEELEAQVRSYQEYLSTIEQAANFIYKHS